jgi:hypothetical protein
MDCLHGKYLTTEYTEITEKMRWSGVPRNTN